MEQNKREKLYKMLKNMSDYSSEQPRTIEDLCNESAVSITYAPAMNLLVEAFLTVYSFSLLMFEGLISNASAILRILIEQVASITVIANNSKAMTEYLKFQAWKKKYFGSSGDEHKRIKEFLIQESGLRYKNENAIKDYLDYGWIRVLNNNKSERGEKLIIKEARLEEFIVDIHEQLNAFAHGQRSIFGFFENKDLADNHVSRIIMVAGKLFLFLCSAKHELLENKNMSADRSFNYYLNAKILFLDLNARSVNDRIVDIIKTTDNLDRDIVCSLSTLDHMRGLIYQSELNYVQVNVIARAYILDLINFMFMICYKLFGKKYEFVEDIKTFPDLINKVGLDKIEPFYKDSEHYFPLTKLMETINRIDDYWGLMKRNGQMSELDELFITDFTSLVHTLFNETYSDVDVEELTKSFIPIN